MALILPANWPYSFASAPGKCQTRHISCGYTVIQLSPGAFFFLTLRSPAQNDPSMKKKHIDAPNRQPIGRREDLARLWLAQRSVNHAHAVLSCRRISSWPAKGAPFAVTWRARWLSSQLRWWWWWWCGDAVLCNYAQLKRVTLLVNVLFFFVFLKGIHSTALHSIQAPISAHVGLVPSTVWSDNTYKFLCWSKIKM